MRWLGWLVIAACGAKDTTAPAPAPPPPIPVPIAPAAGAAYLRWNFEATSDHRIGLAAVSWIDEHDKVVWTHRLGGRIGAISLCCWDNQTEAYLADPRHSTYAGADLEPLVVDDAVVLEHDGELLVLAKSDGHVVFDWNDTRDAVPTPDDPLIMDAGSLAITIGSATCEAQLGIHHFARACGDEVVMFDHGTLALFARKPWALRVQKHVVGTGQDCQKPRQVVDRSETIGDAKLRFRGERLSMCMH